MHGKIFNGATTTVHITNTTRHAGKTVLAIISDKCYSLDIIKVNRNLPIDSLDVGGTDLVGASNHVKIIIISSHRPGLADKVLGDGNSKTIPEASLAIRSSYDGNGTSPRARALLYDIIVEHILSSRSGHGFSVRVTSIAATANRLGTSGEGDLALAVLDLHSARDNEITGRYLAL